MKVKFFGCGELGHYVSQCPNQKKGKKGKQTVASIGIEDLSSKLKDEFALIATISSGGGV